MTFLVVGAVALSLLVPAVVLLVRRQARAAACAMALTAVALVVPAVAAGPVATAVGTLAGTTLGPLVVLTYPWLRARHPVDVLALVSAVGAGLVVLVWPARLDAMALTVVLVLVAHVSWSVARADAVERRALTWLALAVASSTLACLVVAFAVSGAGSASATSLLPFVVVGPALLVGVSRPDVTDARVLVVDGVAHAAAMVGVLAVFVGVGAPVLQARPGWQALSVLGLLAAGLAAAYAPTHRVLRSTAAEVVGVRADPLAAVGLVTRSLGEDPAEALHAVRRALALPWAAVWSDPPLSSGSRTAAVVRVPFNDDLPDLEVGLREGDTRLTRADERLLALAAPLLGQSLRLHALATQLQSSREQTVAAREEERLRLRRDLHDGLGPLLSGLAFTTDAASNLVRRDPAAAVALLGDVRGQAETALDDVRRLVYGMRPPALDELGLVEALRQGTRDLPLQVRLEAPDRLDLTAAVEVAAYRIVVEAVRNAARHADATRVEVALGADADRLSIVVRDDGRGADEWHRGVGLSSMHERAAEVGGRLHAGPTPSGGRVTASLPR